MSDVGGASGPLSNHNAKAQEERTLRLSLTSLFLNKNSSLWTAIRYTKYTIIYIASLSLPLTLARPNHKKLTILAYPF